MQHFKRYRSRVHIGHWVPGSALNVPLLQSVSCAMTDVFCSNLQVYATQPTAGWLFLISNKTTTRCTGYRVARSTSSLSRPLIRLAAGAVSLASSKQTVSNTRSGCTESSPLWPSFLRLTFEWYKRAENFNSFKVLSKMRATHLT